MMRGLLATTLWCASAWAIACPLCMGAFQQSKAQQLVTATHAVLAAPTSDPSRFRVIEVIKGERPPSGTVEGAYPRNASALEASEPPRGAKLRLLIRDDLLPTWTILGTIGADHLGWLRKVAAGSPAAKMSSEEWRTRAVLVLPYLESRERLASEIAYGELAAVPYPVLRTLKSHVAAASVRRWVADPERAAREPLYLLLLGIAGTPQDAARLEQRLDTAWASSDATNAGSMIAADLELRGATRMAWVDEHYLRDPKRSTREIEAALLALSVQGTANGAVPRARVIDSYRMFIRERPDIAGYVAPDLAAWRYWDAVPDYVALIKSNVRQQFPSKLAIVAYLRQSPAGGREIDLPPDAPADTTLATPASPQSGTPRVVPQ